MAGKRNKRDTRPHSEIVLEQMLAYRDLLDRAIDAVRVSHVVSLHSARGYPDAWSTSALEETILTSHLWPIPEDQRRFYSAYSLKEAIPKALVQQLLAAAPSSAPETPSDDDHSRPWVCFLEHRAPEPENSEHDALLADLHRYGALRACPVFRVQRAAHLLSARKAAQRLKEDHGARFPVDAHGRITIPTTIADPTSWVEYTHTVTGKKHRCAIGDIDDDGYRLDAITIVGRTPAERAHSRSTGEQTGWYICGGDETREEGVEIFEDIATLASRWTWVEPADLERIPYSRAPIGSVIQRIERRKPGGLALVQSAGHRKTPNIDPETVVIYRRSESLPAQVLEQLQDTPLSEIEAKRAKPTPKPAPPELTGTLFPMS